MCHALVGLIEGCLGNFVVTVHFVKITFVGSPDCTKISMCPFLYAIYLFVQGRLGLFQRESLLQQFPRVLVFTVFARSDILIFIVLCL